MNTDAIFEAPAPRLYTIAAGRPFLNDLATGLRASVAALPNAELSDALIYLPTRRAMRALSDAFVCTSSGGRAGILPRIRALGDIDEDEFTIFTGPAGAEINLPPAISTMQRRLTLAQMVAARDRSFDGQERWAGALSAADELGKLLDSFYTEEISTDKLKDLAPNHLAAHWQYSLTFLEIITRMWPEYLQSQGLMDPSDRRVKLIELQRIHWDHARPNNPIIIAGTTGSTPAVARLMKLTAELPLGCVVLPGLDLDASENFWETVDDPHPQSGLKQLLKELGADRRDVRQWPSPSEGNSSNRSNILSVALLPARASDSWRDWATAIQSKRNDLAAALKGVELIEAADEEREASVIALKIRNALESSQKNIILATPDRNLARRVSAQLKRWNVVVNDSAGIPFPNSPCGVFLRLVARWLIDPSAPVALMAVLRHPLFGGGIDNTTRKRAVNAIDLGLRGLRPVAGVNGIREKIAQNTKHAEQARPVLDAIIHTFNAWPIPGAPFQKRFSAHLLVAEHLAATNIKKGEQRLWRGEDGETGAALLAQYVEGGLESITHDAPEDYPAIFDQLIANATVRRLAPTHPRVSILGPLEARLQQADVVILGGLNEGVWPRDAAIDPFLSRPMRRELGLPSPEQRIGLAAHDFSQFAAAPEVMLARSIRAGGKPTKPSRWIIRLKNILKGADALNLIERSTYYEALADQLDKPEETIKLPSPRPRPPVESRPKKLFVTRLERLMRDPYAIYARDILKLYKLDAHNEHFDARHIGNLFHKLLQEFSETTPAPTHPQRVQLLYDLFDKSAAAFGLDEAHLPFWFRRIDAAFEWFSTWDQDRRNIGAPAVLEGEGAWAFNIEDTTFTLAARADRIDILKEKSAFIIDYKTGTPPPTKKQQSKFSPQLPLTALIVSQGGFEELGPIPVSGFQYVRVVGRKGDGSDEQKTEGPACNELILEARQGMINLLCHFNDPSTPYLSQPRPQYMDDYGDYDHLARRRERNAQGADN